MYGLIFDVDGVIGDTEDIAAEATTRMFKEMYGFEPQREDYIPFVGTGAERYTAGPAALHGVEIDLPKAVARRSEIFIEMLENGAPVELPGAKTLVDLAARASEWKIAVATAGPTEKSKVTVRAAGVSPGLFDVYITGDMVTHKKPDPEIYLAAIKALELQPEQCVVIEDAVNGVQAAKASGAKCVAVTNNFTAHELSGADLIVDSLEELDLARLEALITSH